MPPHCFTTIGRSLLALCSALTLSACAVLPGSLQPGMWFRSSSEVMHVRLLDIAYPLLTAAAEWCPFDQEPTYGLLLRDQPDDHAVDRPVLVAYVHPRLPAAAAGIAVGDVILEVNTAPVSGQPAVQVGRLIDRLTKAKIQPLQLEFMRDRARRTVALSAIPACHYVMQVLDTAIINGMSDGRRIGVTRGALQFFASDDEVGWVVAHEIAHNILHHTQNMKFQAMLQRFRSAWGDMIDAPDAIPSRPSLEVQADSVGAYLMARAGYDLDAVRRAWAQLQHLEARPGGQKPTLSQTHPPTQERLAAFARTLREIEAKRKTAQPLEPGRGE